MHAHDDWHIFEADMAYLANHEPLAYHDYDWHDRAGIHGYFSWDNDHNSWQGGWLDDAGNGFFSDSDDGAATSSSFSRAVREGTSGRRWGRTRSSRHFALRSQGGAQQARSLNWFVRSLAQESRVCLCSFASQC